MEAHRIAVISDTHGQLRQEVIDLAGTCEAILHAGDIGCFDVLCRLDKIARTFAVVGNVDKEWAEQLPASPPFKSEFVLFGYHIYMVHSRKDIPQDLPGADIVVYGHSHKAEERHEKDSYGREILYLNPGSCGPRRFRQPVTMMVLTLYTDIRKTEVELIDCLSGTERTEGACALSDRDLHKLVSGIRKDVDAGRNVADIAARHRIDLKLAEQICRMYLTHPGVDVDGIIDRIKK